MRGLLARVRRDSSGLTIAELLVAMAISAMVVGLITSTQIAALRWSRKDAETANLNRPLREATNFLTRDIEFASGWEVVGGELRLVRDRRSVTNALLQDSIVYSLDNGTLKRAETPDGAATATVTLLTRGLDSFEPSISANGLIRVRFVVSGTGSDRELMIEILPRKGVGGI